MAKSRAFTDTSILPSSGVIRIMQLTGASEETVKKTLKMFDGNEKDAWVYLGDAGLLGRQMQKRKVWLALLPVVLLIAFGGIVIAILNLLGKFETTQLNVFKDLLVIIVSPLIPFWMYQEYKHYDYLFWSRGEKL